MAFSYSKASVKLWRSMVKADLTSHQKMGIVDHGRRSFVTITTPKFGPVAADADADAARHDHHIVPAAETAKPRWKGILNSGGGEWIPIYMMMGFLGVALAVGIHTAKQQLCHSPVVQVSKKKREMVPEVDNPKAVLTSSGNFINKSFLRKVAHIQDDTNHHHHLPPHSFARNNGREVESLESAGVAIGGRRN